MSSSAGAAGAAASSTQHQPPPPLPPPLQLQSELSAALDELSTSLDEARELENTVTDPEDKAEAETMAAELTSEMTGLMAQAAQELRGITGIGKVDFTTVGDAPAPGAPLPPPAAPRHLVRWEDGKAYACQVTELKYNSEKKTIAAIIEIVGFPGNSANGKKEHANLGHLSQWQGWPSADLVLDRGSKCFAVGDDGTFVPAVVEQVFGAVTVKLLPPSQGNDQAAAAAGGGTAKRLPPTHLRPYNSPPPHGKTLRRRWENMSAEERAEVEAEKKAKNREKAEKQRRQRTEKIGNQASDWGQMKAMFGGPKKF